MVQSCGRVCNHYLELKSLAIPGEYDQLTSTTARPEWTRGYTGNMIDIIGPLILPDEPDPLLGYVTKEELEKVAHLLIFICYRTRT